MKKTVALILSVIIALSSIACINVFAEDSSYSADVAELRASFAELKTGEALTTASVWATLGTKVEDAELPSLEGLEAPYGSTDDFFAGKLTNNNTWSWSYTDLSNFDSQAEYVLNIYSDTEATIQLALYNDSTQRSDTIQEVTLTAGQWIKVVIADNIKGYTGTFNRFAVIYARQSFDRFAMTPLMKLTPASENVSGLTAFELYEKAKNEDYSSMGGTAALIAATKGLDENLDFQKAYLDYLGEKLNATVDALKTGNHTGASYGNQHSGVGNITAATANTVFVDNYKNRLGKNYSCFDLASNGTIWPRLYDKNTEVLNLYNGYLIDDNSNPYTDAVFYLYTGTVTGDGVFQIQYRDDEYYNTIYYTQSIPLKKEMSNQWIRISLKDVDGVNSLADLSNVGRLWLYKDRNLAATGMYLSDLIVITGSGEPIKYDTVDDLLTKAKALDKSKYLDTDEFVAAISAVETQIEVVDDMEKAAVKAETENALISALQTAWSNAKIYEGTIIPVTSTAISGSNGYENIITDFGFATAPTGAPKGYTGKWYSFNKVSDNTNTGWSGIKFSFDAITTTDYDKLSLYVYSSNCKRGDDPESQEFPFTFTLRRYNSLNKNAAVYNLTSDSCVRFDTIVKDLDKSEWQTGEEYGKHDNMFISFASTNAQRQLSCNMTVSELIGYKSANATVPEKCTTIEEWYNAGVEFAANNEFASGKEDFNTALENIDKYIKNVEEVAVTMLGVKRGTYSNKFGYQFGTTVLNTFGGADLTEYGTYIVPVSAITNNEKIYESPFAEKIEGKLDSDSDGVKTYTVSLLNVPDDTNEYVALSYATYSNGTTVYSNESISTIIQ